MVHAHVRVHLKAAHISNRPAKLDTTKSKTTALENLRPELQNRIKGQELDDDASSENEFREFNDAVADASQAHIGRAHCRRRD